MLPWLCPRPAVSQCLRPQQMPPRMSSALSAGPCSGPALPRSREGLVPTGHQQGPWDLRLHTQHSVPSVSRPHEAAVRWGEDRPWAPPGRGRRVVAVRQARNRDPGKLPRKQQTARILGCRAIWRLPSPRVCSCHSPQQYVNAWARLCARGSSQKDAGCLGPAGEGQGQRLL